MLSCLWRHEWKYSCGFLAAKFLTDTYKLSIWTLLLISRSELVSVDIFCIRIFSGTNSRCMKTGDFTARIHIKILSVYKQQRQRTESMAARHSWPPFLRACRVLTLPNSLSSQPKLGYFQGYHLHVYVCIEESMFCMQKPCFLRFILGKKRGREIAGHFHASSMHNDTLKWENKRSQVSRKSATG